MEGGPAMYTSAKWVRGIAVAATFLFASCSASSGPAVSTLNEAETTCGDRGQPCCAGGVCNEPLQCNSNNVCRPCGSLGRQCCANDTCDAGLVCLDGTCSCGDNHQPCCPDGSCNPGLFCNSNNVCRTCGTEGRPCCAGDTCGSGLMCSSGTCVTACGNAGQQCCGGVCNFGEPCLNNVCQPCGFPGEFCCLG